VKTTVDLPEHELAEAMRHSRARTKTEPVCLAVADYNRRQRLGRLSRKLGTFEDMFTRADLRQMRESDGRPEEEKPTAAISSLPGTLRFQVAFPGLPLRVSVFTSN
jgi:hypothetical protein